MSTRNELARALFPRNPNQLGGDVFKWKGKKYIITTGTGDGNYAYLEKDVQKWLDSLDPEADEAVDYNDFVQKVDVQTSKDLAKAVAEELDIDLYDGGVKIKTAEFKLSPADKKVLDAFIDKESADSRKLTTNGRTLDGNWMGGKGIAMWEGGKIQLQETGGKSAQTVHRAIRKMAPRNLVASYQVGLTPEGSRLARKMVRAYIRKLARGLSKEARMSDEARELQLFIENDGQLYRQQYAPIIQNLKRKWDKGRYDFALSIKLFMYLADAGAKKYHAEFGTPGLLWNEAFPKATRMEVAKSLAESFQAEAEVGGYRSAASKGVWFRINPDDRKAEKVLEALERQGLRPAPLGKGPGVKNITDIFYHLSSLDAQRIPGLARYRISADWESFDSGVLDSVEYKIVAGTSGRSRKLVYRGSYVVYGPYGETTVPVEGTLNLSEWDGERTSIEDFVLNDIQAYLDENPELYDMDDAEDF